MDPTTGLTGFYSSVQMHSTNNPREGVDFITEYDFHTLYTEREGAGWIVQGYARMFGCESYGNVHQFLTLHRLKGFIYAFGKEPKGETVPELWAEVRALFGMKPNVPKTQKEIDEAARAETQGTV